MSTSATTAPAAVLLLVARILRRSVRDLGEYFRLLGELRHIGVDIALAAGLVRTVTLCADTDRLALLGLGRRDDLDVDFLLAVVGAADLGLVDVDRRAGRHLGLEHGVRQRVLDVALD